jgi:phosphate transport system protein
MLKEELNNLKKQLIEESMLVEENLDHSFKGFLAHNVQNLDRVFTIENKIDKLNMKIEENCTSLIALKRPGTKNLRTIIAVMKINNVIERMGDLTVNIVKSYKFLLDHPYHRPLIELASLAKESKNMLKNSITSFIEENEDLALNVCKQDHKIDLIHKKFFKILISESDLNIAIAFHLNRISKNYERISDLTTNIAECSIYMIKGHLVKHSALETGIG